MADPPPTTQLRKAGLTRDIRNIFRGFCVTCGEVNCPGFISVSGRVLCDYCGCPPAKHKMIEENNCEAEKGQHHNLDDSILEDEDDDEGVNSSPSTAKKRRQDERYHHHLPEDSQEEDASDDDDDIEEFIEVEVDGADGEEVEDDDVGGRRKRRDKRSVFGQDRISY